MDNQSSGHSKLVHSGTGPGARTLDGCSVEFYRLLPATEEVEVVKQHCPPPCSLLELGCGVGRLSDAFVEAGYIVTAVDNSEEMLRHVVAARTVHSDIESLELNETFDVVLLPSRLYNSINREIRLAFLGAAARHLKPSGQLLIEVHDESILTRKVGDGGTWRDYSSRLLECEIAGNVARMTIEYQIDAQTWTQSFTTEYLLPGIIEQEINESGMQLKGRLGEQNTWVLAGF